MTSKKSRSTSISTKKVKTLVGEKWAKIEGNGPPSRQEYFVSNMARVKSVNFATGEEKLKKQSATKYGYVYCSGFTKEGRFIIWLHKEVATHFCVQESEHHKNIIHSDLNRSNNQPSNLKFVTTMDWMTYRKARIKEFKFYEKRGRVVTKALLNEAQVAIIKKALIRGKTKPKTIAKQFGVSYSTILSIKNGHRWGHVEAAK